MKKFKIMLMISSLFLGAVVYASGSHEGGHDTNNNHLGDHMHNGKMSNHMNPNGATNKDLKNHAKSEKKEHYKELGNDDKK